MPPLIAMVNAWLAIVNSLSSTHEKWYCFSSNVKAIFVTTTPIRIPMHARGPSPNGMNASSLYCGVSSKNRSGQYFSGLGKYSGSRIWPSNEMTTGVPFGMVKFNLSTWYCLVHWRFKNGSVGYFRTDSAISFHNFMRIFRDLIRVKTRWQTFEACIQKGHFFDGLVCDGIIVLRQCFVDFIL